MHRFLTAPALIEGPPDTPTVPRTLALHPAPSARPPAMPPAADTSIIAHTTAPADTPVPAQAPAPVVTPALSVQSPVGEHTIAPPPVPLSPDDGSAEAPVTTSPPPPSPGPTPSQTLPSLAEDVPEHQPAIAAVDVVPEECGGSPPWPEDPSTPVSSMQLPAPPPVDTPSSSPELPPTRCASEAEPVCLCASSRTWSQPGRFKRVLPVNLEGEGSGGDQGEIKRPRRSKRPVIESSDMEDDATNVPGGIMTGVTPQGTVVMESVTPATPQPVLVETVAPEPVATQPVASDLHETPTPPSTALALPVAGHTTPPVGSSSPLSIPPTSSAGARAPKRYQWRGLGMPPAKLAAHEGTPEKPVVVSDGEGDAPAAPSAPPPAPADDTSDDVYRDAAYDPIEASGANEVDKVDPFYVRRGPIPLVCRLPSLPRSILTILRPCMRPCIYSTSNPLQRLQRSGPGSTASLSFIILIESVTRPHQRPGLPTSPRLSLLLPTRLYWPVGVVASSPHPIEW